VTTKLFDLYSWVAKLAPLSVVSADGRALSCGKPWELRSINVPVMLHSPRVMIGHVTALHQTRDALYAAGVIECYFVAQVRGDNLRPQVDLGGDCVVERQGEVMLFHAGSVAAVTLGKTPTFDDVWFTIGRGFMSGRVL